MIAPQRAFHSRLLLALLLCCWRTAPGNAEWELSGMIRTAAGPAEKVWLTITGPQLLPAARTDREGRYRVRGTVPGVYRLYIQKPDDAGAVPPRTISLRSGQKINNYDILLPPGATVQGRVTDETGKPLSGRVVHAYLRNTAQGHLRYSLRGGYIADGNGSYRIDHLPAGPIVVAAVLTRREEQRMIRKTADEPPGTSAYPPVTFFPSGQLPTSVLPLRDGESVSGIDIRLRKEPTYCVSLRPELAGVDAPANTDVWLEVHDPRNTPGLLIGSGSGRPGQPIHMCHLPPGEYEFRLLASTSSPGPMRGYGNGRAVVAVSNRHVDLGTVPIQGLVDLTGTVEARHAAQQPASLEGVHIRLRALDRSLYPSDRLFAAVQKDGSFSLPQMYRGSYAFRVENLPTGHYLVRASQNGRDILASDLRTDSGPISVELAADGPTLSGQVLGPEPQRQPQPQVTVFLVARDSGRFYSTDSDQDGRYTFSAGVPPGDYLLVAIPGWPESQPWNEQLADRYGSRATKVTLSARSSRTLDLTAQ